MSAEAYSITATYETSAAVKRSIIEQKIRDIYNAKFAAQKMKVTSLTFTGYKSFEVAPHIVKQQVTVQVTVAGSPIVIETSVILAILALIKLGLIVAAIYLVGKEIVKPLVSPWGVGLGLVIVLGIVAYAWMKRKR